MMRKVCAKCGRAETLKDEFVGAFCPGCLFESTGAVSSREGNLQECVRCGKVRIGRTWQEETQEAIAELAASKVRSRYDIESATLEGLSKKRTVWRAHLKMELRAEGKRIGKKEDVVLQVERKLCDDCQKLASGYHEFILQVRGTPTKVAKFAAFVHRELEGKTLFTKSEEKHEGLDLFIADKDPAMKLMMRIHRPYTATRSLKGVKKGRHHFITTVCVRV